MVFFLYPLLRSYDEPDHGGDGCLTSLDDK
jgi:hypothetical protein